MVMSMMVTQTCCVCVCSCTKITKGLTFQIELVKYINLMSLPTYPYSARKIIASLQGDVRFHVRVQLSISTLQKEFLIIKNAHSSKY